MKHYKVALAGYYGFGNLGDELLVEAVIAALLRCGVNRSEIVLMSATPEESAQKFGVDSVNRWKVSQVCRTLRQSETLLLGGGGLFQDASSLRSCLYYWWLVRAARFFGVVPWAIGQSVGPLSTRTGRALIRNALSCCRVVQVRDAASEALCDSLGLTVEIGSDLVLSLADFFTTNENTPPARLLVNLRPDRHGLSERFADAMSVHLHSVSFNGELVGVAFSGEDENLMSRFTREGRLPLSRIERATSLSDAAKIFHGTEAMGMRLHFLILAAMAGLPIMAVPYDPKVESFAASQNIPVWRDGPLPSPRTASQDFRASLPKLRQNIDDLCRRVLA